MTPTERARRSDALYYDTESVARRCLCDMIANRESDLEDARAENASLKNEVKLLRDICAQVRLEGQSFKAENAKLRELVRDVYTLHRSGLDCTECPWFDECDTTGGCPWLGILADRMHDLGVEVEQ